MTSSAPVRIFSLLLAPVFRDHAQHGDKARAPVRVALGRQIRAAIKRFQRRREPHTHRPATVPGRGLDVSHIDAINVGPLLAVDFHGHEIAVQYRRHGRILEGFVRHHVTPMARRIADAQEDRFVLGARPRKGFLAPRQPVHGIVGVLAEVGRFFGSEAIGHGADTLAQPFSKAKRISPAAARCHRRAGSPRRGPTPPFVVGLPREKPRTQPVKRRKIVGGANFLPLWRAWPNTTNASHSRCMRIRHA